MEITFVIFNMNSEPQLLCRDASVGRELVQSNQVIVIMSFFIVTRRKEQCFRGLEVYYCSTFRMKNNIKKQIMTHFVFLFIHFVYFIQFASLKTTIFVCYHICFRVPSIVKILAKSKAFASTKHVHRRPKSRR